VIIHNLFANTHHLSVWGYLDWNEVAACSQQFYAFDQFWGIVLQRLPIMRENSDVLRAQLEKTISWDQLSGCCSYRWRDSIIIVSSSNFASLHNLWANCKMPSILPCRFGRMCCKKSAGSFLDRLIDDYQRGLLRHVQEQLPKDGRLDSGVFLRKV
jgi:hypothetical protein